MPLVRWVLDASAGSYKSGVPTDIPIRPLAKRLPVVGVCPTGKAWVSLQGWWSAGSGECSPGAG